MQEAEHVGDEDVVRSFFRSQVSVQEDACASKTHALFQISEMDRLLEVLLERLRVALADRAMQHERSSFVLEANKILIVSYNESLALQLTVWAVGEPSGGRIPRRRRRCI